MPSSSDAISPGQLSVESSSVASNDLSDDCSENLESSAKMASFTNCLPWGGKSQDGRIIFSNTCTIDNMLNIFFYLFLMQPLILDEFRRMGSFAIALTTAYDYFTQGQWAECKYSTRNFIQQRQTLDQKQQWRIIRRNHGKLRWCRNLRISWSLYPGFSRTEIRKRECRPLSR